MQLSEILSTEDARGWSRDQDIYLQTWSIQCI